MSILKRAIIAGVMLIPVLLSRMNADAAAQYVPSKTVPPLPLREFRGAWIASVSNIDWPSKPGLPAAQQKAELLAILNRAVELKLNALVLQVRPACDALYASRLEPWSEFLSGEMGKPPETAYDPLAVAVIEAHARGLELHAWINPFRARHPSGKSPISPLHISKTRPDLVRSYGKHLWLDPGASEARAHSLRVLQDIVRRYDIDGLHMDDYFYPYKELNGEGKKMDFPDDALYAKYQKTGGKLERADWRRRNINEFVEAVYTMVKREKSWVKVGISPFGIWRPGTPAGITGYDPYLELYADSRLWLQKGHLDYFSPQLYWAIEAPGQGFLVLLKWWGEQNIKSRHIWPGISSVKVGNTWKPEEIQRQINLSRGQRNSSGVIHWSMRALLGNQNDLASRLAKESYASPALVPACAWLGKSQPSRPKAYAGGNLDSRLQTLMWEKASTATGSRWVVQGLQGKAWSCAVLDSSRTMIQYNDANSPEIVALYALDRYGNLSQPSVFEKNPRKGP